MIGLFPETAYGSPRRRARGLSSARSLRAKCCGCTEAFQASRAGSIPVARLRDSHGEWRSLVAHPAGGRAVAGSNPVSPTSENVCFCMPFLLPRGVAVASGGVHLGSNLPERARGPLVEA